MSIDISKGVYRAVLAVTATANRVITFPDATDTLAVLNAAQTLAAKTLTGMIVGATDWVTAQHSHAAANSGGTVNAATVTTNANLTGPITSSGNATAVAAQTGTGSTFVMSAGAPTLTSPTIADLSNMQHDHLDADDGGQLTTAALSDYTAPTTWAPSYTNLTTGTGPTQTARYHKIGKHVSGMLYLILGTTPSMSGDLAISVPVTATGTAGTVIGSGHIYDSSATAMVTVTVELASSTTMLIYFTATGANAFRVGAAKPWTWAVSDQIAINFEYEAA